MIACFALGMISLFSLNDLQASEKNRFERPLQVQLHALGGYSLGYHLNPLVYIGAIQTNRFTDKNQNNSSGGSTTSDINDQPGGRTTSNQLPLSQGAEIRFYPFSFDLFFGAGIINTESKVQTLSYDERARSIGSNSYNVGFDLSIEQPKYHGPMLGLGWNQNYQMGLTLTALLYVGAGSTDKPTATLSNYTQPIPAADQFILEQDFQKNAENKSDPSLFFLGVGYAF